MNCKPPPIAGFLNLGTIEMLDQVILCGRSPLCIVGRLTSLPSCPSPTRGPELLGQPKMSPGISKWPLGSKITTVKNPCSKVRKIQFSCCGL